MSRHPEDDIIRVTDGLRTLIVENSIRGAWDHIVGHSQTWYEITVNMATFDAPIVRENPGNVHIKWIGQVCEWTTDRPMIDGPVNYSLVSVPVTFGIRNSEMTSLESAVYQALEQVDRAYEILLTKHVKGYGGSDG